MPAYQGTGQAKLLRENQQVYLYQQETNITGVASIGVQLERGRTCYPIGVSFQIYFADVHGTPVDPEAFEVDVQASDLDQNNMYCTIATVNSGLNASFVAIYSTTTNFMKYARVYLKSLANPVFTSVLVTR